MPGQVSTGAGGLGEELPGDLQSGIDQQSGIDTDGPPTDGGSGMASGPAKFVQEGGAHIGRKSIYGRLTAGRAAINHTCLAKAL